MSNRVALTKEVAAEYLARFCGEPGKTKGLNHDEMMGMLQHYVDSGEIYAMDDIVYHAQAWADEGSITNFDASKMPKE